MPCYRLVRRQPTCRSPRRSPGARAAFSLPAGRRLAPLTHMAVTLVALSAGHIESHVHSYEAGFYVLEGEPVLYLDGRGVRLEPGACGVIPVGAPHAFRAAGPASGSRWSRRGPGRTGATRSSSARRRTPSRSRSTCAIRATAISSCSARARWTSTSSGTAPPSAHRRSPRAWRPRCSPTAVSPSRCWSTSASTRNCTRCSWSTYQPGAVAQPHDHPFEESYYMLEGEVDVVADGDRHTLRPGDFFWTAAGCIHAFYETQGGRVRWLETSAPGPPARHSYRFERTGTTSRSAWHERPRRPRPVHEALPPDAADPRRRGPIQSLFQKGEVHGTTHLYSGQEAVAIGVASAAGGPRPSGRHLPRPRSRAGARRRPAGAARRDARPRDRRLRRPGGIDERDRPRRTADRLASGSSAAASPRRPARPSRSARRRAASLSRTSATAR